MEVVVALFAVFVLTPIVGLAFALFYWSVAKDRKRLEGIWASYARQRNMVFQPPEGDWPNRTPLTLRWAEEGAAFRIEARGDESRLHTSVVARPTVAVFGEVFITRPGADAAAAGDPGPLHGRLVVSARPSSLAARVLTDDVKRALLGFDLGGDLSLVYQRGDVSLGWAGGEENDARLDEGRRVVRRVVDALAATTAIEPTAEAV